MTDLIFVAVIVAFFALSVGLVRLCERIVGTEELAVAVPTATQPPDPTASDATEVAA